MFVLRGWTGGILLLVVTMVLAMISRRCDRAKMQALYGPVMGSALHEDESAASAAELANRDFEAFQALQPSESARTEVSHIPETARGRT